MKTITANELSNVTGGAAATVNPGGTWNPSTANAWQSGAASWGAKAGQAAGQAVGSWWKGR